MWGPRVLERQNGHLLRYPAARAYLARLDHVLLTLLVARQQRRVRLEPSANDARTDHPKRRRATRADAARGSEEAGEAEVVVRVRV